MMVKEGRKGTRGSNRMEEWKESECSVGDEGRKKETGLHAILDRLYTSSSIKNWNFKCHYGGFRGPGMCAGPDR